MSWIAQVRHVFAKDVREGRWLLVGYVILVLMATGHSTGWGMLAGSGFSMLYVIVGFVGMLAVATCVQQDSPTRPDAFWASHPLRPLAVLGAKVLIACLLLGIGLAGQAIAVRSYDLHGSALLRELRASALFFAMLLLAAMVLAALLRDVRSWILALIAMPLVTALTFSLLPFSREDLDRVGPWRSPLTVLVLAALVALLPWLYMRRDTRRRIRAGAFVAISLLLVAASGGVGESTTQAAFGTVRTSFTLEPMQARIDRNLTVNVRRGAVPEGLRVTIAHPELLVRVRGNDLRLPVLSGALRFGGFSNPTLPRDAHVRWIDDVPSRDEWARAEGEMTPSQRRAIINGATSVSLTGQGVVVESRSVASLPLRVGLDTTFDGQRIRIEDWSAEGGDALLKLQVVALQRAQGTDGGWDGWRRGLRFALVNASRGEGVRLESNQGSGSMDGLVLPGPAMMVNGSLLRPVIETMPRGPRDTLRVQRPGADWYRDARLLAYTEVAVSRFPVSVTLPGAPVIGSDMSPSTPPQRLPTPR